MRVLSRELTGSLPETTICVAPRLEWSHISCAAENIPHYEYLVMVHLLISAVTCNCLLRLLCGVSVDRLLYSQRVHTRLQHVAAGCTVSVYILYVTLANVDDPLLVIKSIVGRYLSLTYIL